MLIAGTGGFAMESLEIVYQLPGEHTSIAFFNNVQADFEFKIPMLRSYPIIRQNSDLRQYFALQPDFILGTGNPKTRLALYDLMVAHGGRPYALISPKAIIGKINNTIGNGVNIMSGTVITSNVTIGNGCLLNLNVTVGHDTVIGEFTEVCPGVSISGGCCIHRHVFIGTGATLLPGIEVGEGAVIAAGAVVIKNVEPYTMVAGSPAIVKKKLS